MKLIRELSPKWKISGSASLGLAIGIALNGLEGQRDCLAQSALPNLSPGLPEVIKLSKDKMEDSIVLTYIKGSGLSFKLSVDEIICLRHEGVSENVINRLQQSAAPAQHPTVPSPSATALEEPPAVEPDKPSLVTKDAPAVQPQPNAPASNLASSSPQPQAVQPIGFQASFVSSPSLDQTVWTVESPLLANLAAFNGCAWRAPWLTFGANGLRINGASGPRQFTGLQSLRSYATPLTLDATVTAMAGHAIPFEVYLVSSDLQHWVRVSGQLGGRVIAGEVRAPGPLGGFIKIRVPTSVALPEYGVWANCSSAGLPMANLGNKILADPLVEVPYAIQIRVGADGLTSLSLMNAAGVVLGGEGPLPLGPGPFYVVLAARDGHTWADWQTVQLRSEAPVAIDTGSSAPAPAEAEVPTLSNFQAQLAPYGNWVDVPGCGHCWHPIMAEGWRPYFDGGRWVMTDQGWYWESEYPWSAVFHYGRWRFTSAYGWIWQPGYEYSPAWVLWRHAEDVGYCGWAPLPIGAVFVDGGWMFNGVREPVDFDFGLGVGYFSIVAYDHFWEHDYRHWVISHERALEFYRRSRLQNHYRLEHGRFINESLRRERMAELTHHEIRAEKAHDVRIREAEHKQLVRTSNAVRDKARQEAVHNQGNPTPGSTHSAGTASAPRQMAESPVTPQAHNAQTQSGPANNSRTGGSPEQARAVSPVNPSSQHPTTSGTKQPAANGGKDKSNKKS
jgi:hypothetical protein